MENMAKILLIVSLCLSFSLSGNLNAAPKDVDSQGLWLRNRPEMPWVYMVLALPGDEFDYAEKMILADMITSVADESRLVIRKLESLGGTVQARATPEGVIVIVEGPSALADLMVRTLKTVFVPLRLTDELVARSRNRVWREQQKKRYAPKITVEESSWRGWYGTQSPQGGIFVGHEALQGVTSKALRELHRNLLSRGGQRFFVEGRIHRDTMAPLLRKLQIEIKPMQALPTVPSPKPDKMIFPLAKASVWAMPLWPLRQFSTPLKVSFLRALEVRYSDGTPLHAGAFMREKQSLLWFSINAKNDTKINFIDQLKDNMEGMLRDTKFLKIWRSYHLEEQHHAQRRFSQMGRAPVSAALRWLQLDGQQELDAVPDALYAMRLWYAPETMRLVYTPQKGQDPRIQKWLSAVNR
jgi:hypothetical protein